MEKLSSLLYLPTSPPGMTLSVVSDGHRLWLEKHPNTS